MTIAVMNSTPIPTLVVIPALNEEASLQKVLQEVKSELPDCDCLVVEDGSTDSTASVAREQGVLVASLPYNLGVGGAMRVGFNIAQNRGYLRVIQIDADGQHIPAEARRLLEALDRFDIVLGSRFAGKGNYKVTGPRKWAMKLLASALSKIAKTTLTDTTSGFRASGPRAIELFADEYPAEYLGDTVESLVIAAKSDLSIGEIPVSMRVREGGEPSHNPIKSTIYLARVFIALMFAAVKPQQRNRK